MIHGHRADAFFIIIFHVSLPFHSPSILGAFHSLLNPSLSLPFFLSLSSSLLLLSSLYIHMYVCMYMYVHTYMYVRSLLYNYINLGGNVLLKKGGELSSSS